VAAVIHVEDRSAKSWMGKNGAVSVRPTDAIEHMDGHLVKAQRVMSHQLKR
jgi:hypothetical protein